MLHRYLLDRAREWVRARWRPGRSAAGPLEARARGELVAFLRRWLPGEAKDAYRAMIEADPLHWPEHPHFADGVIVKALRGNGFTERVVGVASLDAVWPELLREAVAEGES
jgi:hypothetical protein